nr:MAG TPA: hypothetical protein [Caudoviricetes sp.]
MDFFSSLLINGDTSNFLYIRILYFIALRIFPSIFSFSNYYFISIIVSIDFIILTIHWMHNISITVYSEYISIRINILEPLNFIGKIRIINPSSYINMITIISL